ncbi:MAG: hypothetical protein IJA85_07415 [Clostridia bacterium]|nr:hypothetical protein [Clostridia bacterium]
MKRLLSILMAAVMLVSLFSCSRDEDIPASVTTAADTAAPETAEPENTGTPEPALPEIDFEGGDFTLLYRGNGATYTCSDIVVEEQNGEIVNDVVYARKIATEEKMKCKVVGVENESPAAVVSKAVRSDSYSCDVMFDQMYVQITHAADGEYLDFNTIPNIDMNAVYWDSNAASDLSVGRKLYMAVSDISMRTTGDARFIYFNKYLVEQYNLPEPYQYVYEDKWTLEVFSSMVKSISEDLDGNSKLDGYDRFGLLEEGPTYFISGAGVKFTEKDDEDIPQISFMNERTVKALELIGDFLNDETHAIGYQEAADGHDTSGFAHVFNYGRSLFATDHFLFVQNGAGVSNQFTNMEHDYGVVPNPKFDETQEEYYHLIDAASCSMSVPTTNTELDRTGAVLEYMSWYSHDTLVPAYYETTIKLKRLQDEDAPKMMDIIRDSIRYEISYIAGVGIEAVLAKGVSSGDLASAYAKQEKSINKKLEKIIDKLTD